MPRNERFREPVSVLPDERELERRAAAGWRPVAIEWERTLQPGASASVLESTEVPYGLRAADGGLQLEQNEREVEAMMLMLDLLVQDQPLSEVASELGRRGFAMRNGAPWTQTAVFQLLPRLVEVGPSIYASSQWSELRRQRRQPLLRVVNE
jgi:hypothetical protein